MRTKTTFWVIVMGWVLLLAGVVQGQTSDEQLAEKFKPILVLDSRDNDQSPKEVDIVGAESWENIYYEGNVGIINLGEIRATDWYSIKGTAPPGVDTTTGNYSNLKNVYEIGSDPVEEWHPHFEFADTLINGSELDGIHDPGWETYYNDVKDEFEDRFYAHVFDHPDGTSAVIQYWFFYPYNDWWNNHEGDWEHINVIVSSRNPEWALADTIEYYGHGEYMWRAVTGSVSNDNPAPFVQVQGGSGNVGLGMGNRPVVYVGGWGSHINGYGPGGHASFPTPGQWTFELWGFSELNIDDNPDGSGRIVTDATIVVLRDTSDYDYDATPEMSWFKADIKWGHRAVSSPLLSQSQGGHLAPEGPAHKGTWQQIAPTAGTTLYTPQPPNALYQHHFVVGEATWSGEVELIGDIVIYDGATLTIEPGTIIRSYKDFDIHEMGDHTGRIELIVQSGGTLRAIGIPGNPIVFQSEESTPGNNDWEGIIGKGGDIELRHCVIRHANTGIKPGGGTVIVEDCEFEDNFTAVNAVASMQFARNDIHDSYGHGIFVQSGVPITFQNNLIHHNGWKGVFVAHSNTGHISLTNNTISHNEQSGILVVNENGDPVTILNTISTLNGDYGLDVEENSVIPLLKYSDVWGNDDDEFGGEVSGWNANPNASPNVGNILTDPDYVDEGVDFHLSSTSPAIDAGDPAMTDPDATRINMGRYGGTPEAEVAAGGLKLLSVVPQKQSIKLTWQPNGDASYWVRYGTQSGVYTDSTEVANTDTTKVITGLTNDVQYYFQVNASGEFTNIPSDCRTDYDGLGSVDFPDFLLFVDHYHETPDSSGYEQKYDLSGNLRVDSPEDSTDFKLFMGDFGLSCNQVPKRAVPVFAEGKNRDAMPALFLTQMDAAVYVDVEVTGAMALTGYEVVVQYDPSVFAFAGQDTLPGMLLGSDAVLRFAKAMDGHVFALSALKRGHAPGQGDGSLMSLRFEKIGAFDGDPPISLHRMRLADDARAIDQLADVALAAKPATEPVTTLLAQNMPNPFNPETTIAFSLAEAMPVYLMIYSALGQEVRRIYTGEMVEAGAHRLVWNGTDNAGRQVSSGVYIYEMRAGDFRAVRRMVFLK